MAECGRIGLARLFVIFGGLIVLVLTAALVVPFFIDWSPYRADFEREASRILGRDVIVRGDARARLLPLPSVTFTDVEVAGTVPGQPAMTVDTFSMDAELAPFMRGELLIFDMRIVRPKARIAVAADGTVDWALRPSTPFDPAQVTLERVTITEGQILIDHAAGGREHQITEINTEISARTLAGPWRLNGSMRFDGALTDLSASTGQVNDDGTMRLRFRAEPERYGFNVETDGDASLKGGAFGYEGLFKLVARKSERLRGADGDTFALDEGATANPQAPPAYRVSGNFTFDHELVDVKDFRFETGPLADPYVANGTASIALGLDPRFEIKADGAQVRFSDEADTQGTAQALGARLDGLREALFDLPRPEIPGKIEVNLPAIVAGDTTIRDVKLSAEPVEGGWSIASLGATLPGRATLEGNGLLKNTAEDFGFDGRLLLAIGQPSGFAAWLSKDVDEAVRRLPAAGFSADVELRGDRQVLNNLELILGDARFNGRIVNEQPADQRPAMTLELNGGKLDVEGLTAFASLFVSDSGTTRLADHDFDFKVKAGPVSVAGITAEKADTALRLRDGRLEIDRLSLTGVEGSSISATGSLNGIGTSPSGSLDASVISGDLAPLISLLAQRFPSAAFLAALEKRAAAFPGIFGEAELNFVARIAEADAGSHRVSVETTGEAGGSTLNFGLTGTGMLDDPFAADIAMTFTAANDEPGAIYALYGLPALPFGFAGAIGTEMEINGSLAEGAATKFRAAGDGLTMNFEGTVKADAAKISASGDGSIESIDLEPWLMTAGVTLPGMGLGVPVKLAASFDLEDGLLIASGLKGSIANNAVAGDINASIRDGLPHVTGAINVNTLDLGLLVAAVLGEASMDMEDGGVWPRIPFEPTTRPPFSAELDLAADNLALQGELHAKNAHMSARMNREGVRISDLSTDYDGGKVSGLIELSNNGGTGLFSGQLQASDTPVRSLLPEAGLSGNADFSASLTASGKTIEGMMASLSGSGSATVHNLVVPGLQPGAFQSILAEADKAGADIDSDKTAAFAPALVRDGKFEAEATEFAITIAGGVLRAPPVVLERPEATLTVEARADLAEGTVGASGEFAYKPGIDEVIGADPTVRFDVSGPPGNVAVNLDTAPLGQFLTQRALEREQARVEAMQSQLLERQRLRREVRYYTALHDEREQMAALRLQQEEADKRAAAQAKKLAEEAKRKAEEDARRKEEEDAKRRADDEAMLRAEADALRAIEAERLKKESLNIVPNTGTVIERDLLPPPTKPNSGDQADNADVSGSNMTVEGLLKAIDR